MCAVANIVSFKRILFRTQLHAVRGTYALCWKSKIVEIGLMSGWSLLKEERVGQKVSVYPPTQMTFLAE